MAFTYKFALAQSLSELAGSPNDLITLNQLAEPFSRHLSEHLKHSDKQSTAPSSKFLDACRGFNKGKLSKEQLINTTVRSGFNNVIDAFHVVNQGEVGVRFFLDERKTQKGIRLTEDFFKLAESTSSNSLQHETEARWRLVETAWELGLSRNLVAIEHDDDTKVLTTTKGVRRTTVTSSRDALNGYQKGLCFYCFTPISIVPDSPNLADVDHYFPFVLEQSGITAGLNGVWNLVLACQDCNRGEQGKFARVPSLPLLERLSRRNEYLIGSHHPLRETLMMQTGATPEQRSQYLQTMYTLSKTTLIHDWQPEPKGPATF